MRPEYTSVLRKWISLQRQHQEFITKEEIVHCYWRYLDVWTKNRSRTTNWTFVKIGYTVSNRNNDRVGVCMLLLKKQKLLLNYKYQKYYYHLSVQPAWAWKFRLFKFHLYDILCKVSVQMFYFTLMNFNTRDDIFYFTLLMLNTQQIVHCQIHGNRDEQVSIYFLCYNP